MQATKETNYARHHSDTGRNKEMNVK